MDDFDKIFFNEVLKPQLIIPMKRIQEDQETWENLYGCNSNFTNANIVVEVLETHMIVEVEGTLDKFNPANLKGKVFGERIAITENDLNGKLMLLVPSSIGNWVLEEAFVMGRKQLFNKEMEKIIMFETSGPDGRENFVFTSKLYYKN